MRLYFKPRLLLCTFLICLSIIIYSCSSVSVEKLYDNGVVATSSPIASQVGLDILESGGNAFDAAIAVGFALAVTHPQAGNIGGGGFALLKRAGVDNIEALDFREMAPLGATRDMYLDINGDPIENKSILGAASSGVPGTVAGLFEIWKRYGSLDWFDLVQPAMVLADSGFIVTEYLANSIMEYRKDLSFFPETEKLFFKNGQPVKSGELLIQKDLARTLDRIGRDSTDGFYAGETAELIVSSMQKNNGLISAKDLSNYHPIWRRPVQFEFDKYMIYSMPPPSSGGVILGEILKMIESYDFELYSPNSPEYIHLFAEACRLAYADRAVHLGDPDFVNNPVDELLSDNYITARSSLINPDAAGNSEEIGSGISEKNILPESESTTHFCIVDKDHNIVSLTYTLNASYGSKLVVDGAGFLLNNEMDDFSVKPGIPNIYGLVGGEANEIVPGKRMLSSMSPTIIMKNDRPVMALGSPGGSKIITTVAEAIINFIRFDMTASKIAGFPRFHHQWLPDTLYLEQGGFDLNTIQALISKGHRVKERSKYSDLQIIFINDNGLISGASDPRENGKTLGY
ncbi:MAG: gamma-glutamyltransferase [Candidatus Zixiibacteriota bacterium]